MGPDKPRPRDLSHCGNYSEQRWLENPPPHPHSPGRCVTWCTEESFLLDSESFLFSLTECFFIYELLQRKKKTHKLFQNQHPDFQDLCYIFLFLLIHQEMLKLFRSTVQEISPKNILKTRQSLLRFFLKTFIEFYNLNKEFLTVKSCNKIFEGKPQTVTGI